MNIYDIIKLTIGFISFLVMKITFAKPKCLILYYHGVLESEIDNFKKQMRDLANICQVVPLKKIFTARQEGRKNIVAITFDDAFENLLENAVPILKELGLPASIFVPVDNLADYPQWDISEGNPDKNEQVMDADSLRRLDEDGFEIGSHTLSHPNLTLCSKQEQIRQIKGSKVELERILGHDVSSISYPHGAYDEGIVAIVKNSGYSTAYTIEPDCVLPSKTNTYEVPRYVVLPSDSRIKFRLIVSGAYAVICYLKRLLRIV